MKLPSRAALYEWLRRYAPAEAGGLITAVAGALLVRNITGSLLAAAVAGNFSEGIGFYGFTVTRELLKYYRQDASGSKLKRAVSTAWHTARGLGVEFAPAEVIDTLFFRPALFFMLPQVLHNFFLGIVLGKFLSDIIFYAIAIVGYELHKRWFGAPPKSGGTVQ